MSKQFANPKPDSFDTVLTLEQKWLDTSGFIPRGSLYNGSSQFLVLQPPLVGLGTYQITLGANDVSAGIGAVGGPLNINDHNTHTFQLASNGFILLTGTGPGVPVTTSLIRLS